MKFDVFLDSTGFPMLWVDKMGLYVQWLPVTKIQLEYFLCATNDTTFDENWYYQVNQFNPRIAPAQASSSNYFQTLATGIKPREGLRYAVWCGKGYDLPTASEWQEIYGLLSVENADPDHLKQVTASAELKERPKRLLNQIGQVAQRDHKTLADQLLMNRGIMEYVYENDERNSFVGLGVPHEKLVGSIRRPDNVENLTNPTEGTRMKQYGFRLIHRGKLSGASRNGSNG